MNIQIKGAADIWTCPNGGLMAIAAKRYCSGQMLFRIGMEPIGWSELMIALAIAGF